MTETLQNIAARFLPWVLMAGFLVPLILIQPDVRIPGDAAWLTGAAQEFLAGRRMTEAYYDNNPPMSYMIFVPAALMMRAGLPVGEAILCYTVMLAGVSFLLCAMMLKAWPELDRARYFGLLATFIATTLTTGLLEFGQKDHLIALALFPFLLAQFAVTYKHSVSPWILRAAFILGTPFILLKPHFGLLPVIMLVHRAITQRRISVVLDFDFLVLAAGVLFYAAAIGIWFPDFISEVLLYSLNLYVTVPDRLVYFAALSFLGFGVCMLTVPFLLAPAGNLRRYAIFLSVVTIAGVIPLFTQMKGYSVHTLPVLALAMTSLFMTVSILAGKVFERRNIFLPSFTVFIIFAFFYLFFPPVYYPRHEDYLQSGFAKLVQEKAAGSSFFMQAKSTYVVTPVSIYTGIPHASRFSCLWFMAGLLHYQKEDTGDPRPWLGEAHKNFTDYIAADFARHKPKLVALYADPKLQDDFLLFMKDHAGFMEEWQNYAPAGQFLLDYDVYTKNIYNQKHIAILYDLYERKPPPAGE